MSNNEIFSKIRGVIWDLDNTLYRLDEALVHAFNLSIARMAVQAGVPLTLEEAVDLGKKSFEESGYSGRVFIDKYGMDQHDLHYNFHRNIDETAIIKSVEVYKLFSELNLSNILITHGAFDWAIRVLSHLELREFFPDQNILALEHYDFERKYESDKSFMMALKKIRMIPEHVLFIEDTVENLEIPHAMGINTVFIHHGKKPKDLPDFVDFSYNSALDVLLELKAA
jgi:putative hydrolase of the HAD superfamily